MPRELTQNRIQKIWVPAKDGKPAPRRVEVGFICTKICTLLTSRFSLLPRDESPVSIVTVPVHTGL
ncbi:hypothetical protein WMY93_021300 [Mugilogobius chulae]|uniref:Uncharacterized protein n=1 Tax=Mugilogobius chulae TaxID=88201 RepID=A0AAW0NDG2_9GOBI